MILTPRNLRAYHIWWVNKQMGYQYLTPIKLAPTPLHLRHYKGFEPSVAPIRATEKERKEARAEPIVPLHHNRSVILAHDSELTVKNEGAMCAKCRRQMKRHPVPDLYDDTGTELLHEGCERSPEQFGQHIHDYYQYGGSNWYVPFEDYSGTGGRENERYMEWDDSYIPADSPLGSEDHVGEDADLISWTDYFQPKNKFGQAISYRGPDWYFKSGNSLKVRTMLNLQKEFFWEDRDPTQFVAALDRWLANKENHYARRHFLYDSVKFDKGSPVKETLHQYNAEHYTPFIPETSNIYVDGADGFADVKILDWAITEKSHNKFLNVYFKDGILRCGGLQIFPTRTVDPISGETWVKVTARCGNRQCREKDSRGNYTGDQRKFSIEGYWLSRQMMEDFIYSVIRHGNNHAADWFLKRKLGSLHSERSITRSLHNKERDNETGQLIWNHDQKVISFERFQLATANQRTFYKVHDHNCDLPLGACDENLAYCNSQLASK